VLTEARVWEALAEVPDPEIPVISIVDLGVVRGVEVEDGKVRVEFTPTFLGCPALEVMRSQMAAVIAELGAEPEVEVIMDDSWSTDRITPEGREKLRDAGFAPPAHDRPARVESVPLPLLRLERHRPREHLRPDPVPVAPLLPQLQAAVRAVQDDLT
jgi:ring-1,2-phenylacetyl-CoA epoxidase subunit PaaD